MRVGIANNGGFNIPKIVVIYDSISGNTEKLSQAIAEGAREVPGMEADLINAEEIKPEEIAEADAFAFGSPSHFSIMSGKILTMFTNLYPLRHKIAEKPACVVTAGCGGQVTVLDNIDKVLGLFNPRFVKPGVVVEGTPKEFDIEQAKKLGKKLAEAIEK